VELDYWVKTSGLTIEQIAESFFDQPETQAKFAGLDAYGAVTLVYENLFNRAPDAAGLQYWADQIIAGDIALNDMIIAIVNGALGTDQDTLDNKTDVVLDYAASGLDNLNQKTEIMEGVTNDPATVQAAMDQINVWENEGAGFKLTTSEDDIVGSANDDIIEGSVTENTATSTYQSFDNINGGTGNDTLELRASGGIPALQMIATASMESVETLNLTDQSLSLAMIYEGVDVHGLETVNIDGAGNALGFEIFRTMNDVVELGLSQQTSQVVSLSYTGAAIAGTDDHQVVNLNTNAFMSVIANGIETLDLHTGTGVQGMFDGTGAETVIIDGGASTLYLSGTASATVLDATAMTGRLYIRDDMMSNAGSTVSTGSGNDVIGQGVAMVTNAGTTQTISTDGGNDEIHVDGVAGSRSVVIGGTGKDTTTDNGTSAQTIFQFAKTGDSGPAISDADRVVGFTTAEDFIDFVGLGAGPGRYNEQTATSILQAEVQAEIAFAANITYSLQQVGIDSYLFVDSNDDDQADSVVLLQSITTGIFTATDIA
jgi:hypothetical protein